MGVPQAALPTPAGVGASNESVYMNGVDAEAIFLYHDPDKNELFLADKLPADRLNQMLKGTDASVKIGLQRMRLGAPDDREFQRYSSGGLLFDTSQATAAKPGLLSSGGTLAKAGDLAWSIFSALLPGIAPKGGPKSAPAGKQPSGGRGSGSSSGRSGGKQTATGSKAKGGESGAGGSSAANKSGGGGGGGHTSGGSQGDGSNLNSPSSAPLQPLEQVHTMQLPNGMGETRLTVFVKDRKKSVFGMLISAFGTALTEGASVYMPLLNLGGIPQEALKSITSFVANLHTNGDQKMVFGTPNAVPLIAARDKIPQSGSHVQLVPGNYLIVRKGHLKYLSGKTTGVMMYDGFLLPKNDDFTTYYDQAADFASDASYISLSVGVDPIKIKSAGCAEPSKA